MLGVWSSIRHPQKNARSWTPRGDGTKIESATPSPLIRAGPAQNVCSCSTHGRRHGADGLIPEGKPSGLGLRGSIARLNLTALAGSSDNNNNINTPTFPYLHTYTHPFSKHLPSVFHPSSTFPIYFLAISRHFAMSPSPPARRRAGTSAHAGTHARRPPTHPHTGTHTHQTHAQHTPTRPRTRSRTHHTHTRAHALARHASAAHTRTHAHTRPARACACERALAHAHARTQARARTHARKHARMRASTRARARARRGQLPRNTHIKTKRFPCFLQ